MTLTIVTGASANHGNSLVQFLGSVRRWESSAAVRVYDLGLRDKHRDAVAALGFDLIRFPFSDYPEHLNIEVNAGEYAWKPVIMQTEVQRANGPVLWMDAGNLIHWPLWGVRRAIRKEGLYSTRSSGTVAKWTHPKMFEALGMQVGTFGDRSPLSGAVIGVDPANQKAREVIKAWRDGALDKHVIAPEGSSRENHRQDQALITLLAYRSGIKTRPSHRARSFSIHRDVPEA